MRGRWIPRTLVSGRLPRCPAVETVAGADRCTPPSSGRRGAPTRDLRHPSTPRASPLPRPGRTVSASDASFRSPEDLRGKPGAVRRDPRRFGTTSGSIPRARAPTRRALPPRPPRSGPGNPLPVPRSVRLGAWSYHGTDWGSATPLLPRENGAVRGSTLRLPSARPTTTHGSNRSCSLSRPARPPSPSRRAAASSGRHCGRIQTATATTP